LFSDFYLGEFDWRGKHFKGNHAPLFSKIDVYQARQRSQEIGHIHSGNALKKEFPFKRLNFFCADCNCRITAEKKTKHYKRTHRDATYILYHCTKSKAGWKGCPQPTINKDALVKEFAKKAVAPIDIDKDLANFLFEELDNQATYDMREREKILDGINRRLGQLETELHNLLGAYIAGRIEPIGERSSDQIYEEFRVKKVYERDLLLRKRTGFLEASDNWKEKASNFFSLCVDATNRFLKAEDEKQANFLRVITSNVLLDSKQLIVTHQFPFSVLLKYPERPTLLRGQDSNLEP